MSNLILDFKKNESVISQDRLSVAGEEDGIILHTYFVMPVRFTHNEIDFFELFGDPWLSIPLLHFASIGYDEVLKAYKGTPAQYYIPDIGHRLIFEKQDDSIRVVSTLNNCSDLIDAQELLRAFDKFSTKVKITLTKEVPEVFSNNYWGDWLRR